MFPLTSWLILHDETWLNRLGPRAARAARATLTNLKILPPHDKFLRDPPASYVPL